MNLGERRAILKRLLTAMLAVAVWIGLDGGNAHASFQFQLDSPGGGWVTGNGYGIDSGTGNFENGGQLLDVSFGISGVLANAASLPMNAGDSWTFAFGSITLNETDLNSTGGGNLGIKPNETDNLGVTAYLNFVAPPAGTISRVAVVGAVTGAVNDVGADYTVTFTSQVINFGNGGSFLLELGFLNPNDSSIGALNFFSTGDSKSVTARITLRDLPTNGGNQGSVVPEPTSMALAGLAGIGMAIGAIRRRRQSKAEAA